MIVHPNDNVEVRADGHKYALADIPRGARVVKYGMPIGRATRRIARGELVHVHNLASEIAGCMEYSFEPFDAPAPGAVAAPAIRAFPRADGRFGVRNDIWVIPTVGCVNALCERLAAACGGFALTHPYGCSQLGADHESTANILAALCRHPNAGGVLVVALGCENNTLESFRERIGGLDGLNIRFLRAQDPGDEFARGMALVGELLENRATERVEVPASALVVGLKCGGSDGFSGLTANPLVGRFTDWLVARGGSAVMTEVPEMFGAETILLRRCRDRAVFDRCAAMVNGFKDYYARHGQPSHENPSPGNRAGGITTLEEKSIGCVQKGGTAPVEDVIEYGARVSRRGLTLLAAPGNDLVSATALAASGCHIVIFTTGRGTPFGSVVPTFKVASNSALAAAKPHWVDWDAEANQDVGAFARRVLGVASGEQVASERMGNHAIAIWKDGVTL
ncbi:MAG: altronate dehydratase [Kiritimatiellae bacterium]|nr:altronate dehydratase [Kiritimatiellia bacterium]